jgi:hypothetical protein
VEEGLRTQSFQVRLARPAHVKAIFRLKQELARAEGNEGVLRATARDWLRGGSGRKAQFTSLVAEGGGGVLGMPTYSPICLIGVGGARVLHPRARHQGG